MDVKTGSGAFLPDAGEAERLARSLVEVGARARLPVVALLTDMDEPLAPTAGNALEVRTALDHLTGRTVDQRVHEVVLALGGAMLHLGGLTATALEGEARLREVLRSGAAAERFARMVVALGGPSNILEAPNTALPQAPVVKPVPAPRAGTVAGIDTRALGLAVVVLGGGRRQPGEPIDPRVGLSGLARVGTSCEVGEPLACVHAADEAAAARAAQTVTAAYRIDDSVVEPKPLVGLRIGR
jgi:thymidine phosphorylase